MASLDADLAVEHGVAGLGAVATGREEAEKNHAKPSHDSSLRAVSGKSWKFIWTTCSGSSWSTE